MQKMKTDVKILKTINFRFFGLLCITFLLQHLSFATLQNTFGFANLNSNITQNSYFEKGSAHHHDSEIDLFIEVESEDEDEVHNEHVNCKGCFCSNSTFNAFQYAGAINTLYLRLVLINQHKVELPFFVLYHSWKSHLA